MYSYKQIHTGTIVHTSMYLFVLIYNGTSWIWLVTLTATIPHKFSKHKGSGFKFPMGTADTANADGRRGKNVYEVNTWLWMFARCKPRLVSLWRRLP